MDTVSKLCNWYERQCVEDWHEDSGVTISTLDNPGWSLKIDLRRTTLQEKTFQNIQTNRSDRDWISICRNGDVFEAFGGLNNLNEMIKIFLDWTEKEENVV